MSGREKHPTIAPNDLARFKTLVPLVESMHDDVRELARKNQNAPLSKSRVSMINRLLSGVKILLKEEPTAEYLPLLDEETLPQNADALLTLGQFKAALDQFREKYTYFEEDEEQTYWRTSGRRLEKSEED